MTISDIKKGVSRLSVKEQAALAYWIIDGLKSIPEDKLNTAWRKEIRARVELIKSGSVQMIPADEMWKEIMDDYVKTG